MPDSVPPIGSALLRPEHMLNRERLVTQIESPYQAQVTTIVAGNCGGSALYVGEAWGTPWDYIFALAWGLTTQAVVATIAGAIGGLGALGALRHGVGVPRLSR